MADLITYSISDGTVFFKVSESIHSENAPRMKEMAEAVLHSVPHDKIIWDLSSVEYISSAGLRVLLNLYATEKDSGNSSDDFILSGVQPVVYDTLATTGLASIFRVSKAIRNISLKDATLIGNGFFSQVYRIDSENIVKVYNKNATDEDIRRELERAKYALILGIPTAISYDIVEADGRKGVLFEMMNCGTLRDALRDNPAQENHLLNQYTALLKKLHACEDINRQLPDARSSLLNSMEKIKVCLTSEEAEQTRYLLESLPESDKIIHGDCHIKNIMLHNGELELIDLDTLSHGSSLIEMGNLCYTYFDFILLWPESQENFLGISREQIRRIGEELMKRYYFSLSPEEYEKNMRFIRFIGWYRMLIYITDFVRDDSEALEKALQYFRSSLAEAST